MQGRTGGETPEGSEIVPGGPDRHTGARGRPEESGKDVPGVGKFRQGQETFECIQINPKDS